MDLGIESLMYVICLSKVQTQQRVSYQDFFPRIVANS